MDRAAGQPDARDKNARRGDMAYELCVQGVDIAST
jgi:hypothetical protein